MRPLGAVHFDELARRLADLRDLSADELVRLRRRPRPVRVRLRRVNANLAKAYPPDGENQVWWARLKQALGTRSSDFVDASLYQLQAAAQLPCGGISEMTLNAALAMIETAAPRDDSNGDHPT
jgi:hypothetical protein